MATLFFSSPFFSGLLLLEYEYRQQRLVAILCYVCMDELLVSVPPWGARKLVLVKEVSREPLRGLNAVFFAYPVPERQAGTNELLPAMACYPRVCLFIPQKNRYY